MSIKLTKGFTVFTCVSNFQQQRAIEDTFRDVCVIHQPMTYFKSCLLIPAGLAHSHTKYSNKVYTQQLLSIDTSLHFDLSRFVLHQAAPAPTTTGGRGRGKSTQLGPQFVFSSIATVNNDYCRNFLASWDACSW